MYCLSILPVLKVASVTQTPTSMNICNYMMCKAKKTTFATHRDSCTGHTDGLRLHLGEIITRNYVQHFTNQGAFFHETAGITKLLSLSEGVFFPQKLTKGPMKSICLKMHIIIHSKQFDEVTFARFCRFLN